MNSGQPRLAVQDIGKSYGKAEVLAPTSFSIDSGEILAILGPSGCGKTTLLSIISGLIQPSAGEVFLDGKPLTAVPTERRGIPMVFQDHLLFPGMSVFENVAFGLMARKYNKVEIKRRVDEVLVAVKLQGLEHRQPAELSGGQKQRVALARAIVLRPSILLLDEPFSNLDEALRLEMRELVLESRAGFGFSAIIVTHDSREALAMADRIAVMRKGKIEQLDIPAAVYFKPATTFAARFLGHSNLLPCQYLAPELLKNVAISNPGQARPDVQGYLCIRPENITILTEHQTANCLQAVVKTLSFSGPRVNVCLASAAGIIRCELATQNAAALNSGQRVGLVWDSSAASIIHGNDQEV
jgi:ABC-type Fe3+/spermidine/putrescine transport system ATPase subunit